MKKLYRSKNETVSKPLKVNDIIVVGINYRKFEGNCVFHTVKEVELVVLGISFRIHNSIIHALAQNGDIYQISYSQAHEEACWVKIYGGESNGFPHGLCGFAKVDNGEKRAIFSTREGLMYNITEHSFKEIEVGDILESEKEKFVVAYLKGDKIVLDRVDVDWYTPTVHMIEILAENPEFNLICQ